MRKTNLCNRLLSLVLCICMVLSMMPGISLPVFAADAVSYVDYTWNEETGVLSSETKSVTEHTEVTGSTTSMSNGWYVVNGEITISSRITVTGTVHLILVDGAHLTASSGITVNEGNSLYIYAQSSDESTMGKLTAASSTDDATIGGLYKNHAGIIEINGGNINTSMTGSGACIGSSWACGGYHITINGGKVTATNSSGNGAAIGSGDRVNMANSQGSVHSITINGGVVNATVEKNSGAAIGGGLLFSGGDITITGGTIVAKTSSRGAAIGGGEEGDGGNITITGGTVVAKNTNSNSRGSAGIGGGYRGSGGNITITGGNVTAVGGWGAAGIGGYANAGNIVITGGTINSTGNVRACGIGGGVAGVNGSIAILTSDVKITQGASGKGNIGFGENNNGTGSTMLLDGNTVTVSGAYTLPVDYIIPEGTTLCISSGASLTIPNGLTLTNNGTITVEEGGSLINNDVFVQNGVFTNNGTFTCAHSVITDDWTSENGKHYKECLSGCGTKLEEECSGGVADCLQAGICEVCGEDYIPIDPDNHVSEDTYIEYIDDTNHGLYHTCCQALIEQIAHTPAEGQESTCTGTAICADCGIAFGATDAANHTGELVYVSNGKQNHIQIWDCCRTPNTTPEPHALTCTAEGLTITAVCDFCAASGTVTLNPSVGGTYNGYAFTSAYEGTDLLGGWDAFVKPAVSYCCEGGCKTAGTHTVTMTLGEASVSAEFTITPKTLTIGLVKAHYKSYDGTSDLNVGSVSLDGIVVYDEGDYSGEWDDVRDEVKLVYENMVYTFDGIVPGTYSSVDVSGVSITGNDAANYVIAESFEDVPLLDSDGHEFQIYNQMIWITAHDQLLVGEQEIDQNGYSIEGLEKQFTIEGITLYDNVYSQIEIDPYSISIYLDGENVTDYFDITTYPGILSRVCEGHEYDANGFCATGECDSFEPAMYTEGSDQWGGTVIYYDIYNAGQLYWFAEQINTYGNNYIYGRLMADITVNEDLTAENLRQWTPIGRSWPAYCGMFEGNDYTISGLYVSNPEMDYVGLFGYTDYGYQISNIHLTNSYFEGNSCVGGLFGYAGSYISGCTVSDSVTVKGNSSLGGIIGNTAYGELNNSWSAATVIANENAYYYGGLVGYNCLSINNCYTTGSSLVGVNNDSYGGSVNNSYYLSEEETEDGGKTAAQFASGEVAYLLQSGIVGEEVYDEETNSYITLDPEHIWGQTIGTDGYPVLGGEKVYQITNCVDSTAYSNTNVSGQHIDADNSGRCDTCNCLMQPALLRMVSISLKGNIALNYYMLLSDEVLADSTAYMQFTMADGEIIQMPVSKGVKYEYDGETYYVFSCAVNAKEMTDDIVSQFFYEGGSTKEHTYNVQTYAKHILANYDDEATKNLITSMLNYGAASQTHFGYNTDNMANAELVAPDYSDVTISGFNATPGQGTELAKLYSASLILKSETTLRFFFQVDSSAAFTATYNGQALEVKQRSGLYYVDVVGIAAKDLDENVTVTISDGTNTADVSFNPMSYCQGVLNDTTGAFDQEMKDLVAALYLYNQAANVYFKES